MLYRFTFFILGIVSCLVIGCSFKPVYSQYANNLPVKIGSITFLEVPSRLDLIFKKSLEETLNLEGKEIQAQYLLDIKLLKSSLSFATQSNSINSRTRVDLAADYTLTDLETNKVIISDKVIAMDSFEITQSPYSNVVSEEEILNVLARNLSAEIRLRLASIIDL